MGKQVARWLGALALCGLWAACSGEGSGASKQNPDAGDDASMEDAAVDAGEAPPNTFEPLTQPSPIVLSLDRVIYTSSDSLRVTLDLGDLSFDEGPLYVAVAGTDTSDAEPLELEPEADNRFVSKRPLALAKGGDPVPNDGILTLSPGETLVALFFVDKTKAAFADVSSDVVHDLAWMADDDPGMFEVAPSLALSDDEERAEKPSATLFAPGSLPVQVATDELMVTVRDTQELERFLALAGGEVLAEGEPDEGPQGVTFTPYLVRVDTGAAPSAHLSLLRRIFGEEGALYASRRAGFDIAALALMYQLEGFVVAVNPRLAFQAPPALDPTEAENVNYAMELTAARTVEDGVCIPHDPERTCVGTVPAVWAFNALWGRDRERIKVAILDMGFAPDADFRTPAAGPIHQCDMTTLPPRCGEGLAEGPPTVNNSGFGGRSWHGTAVTQILGGVTNNGYGVAGVGGQVAVPMLYKYDFRAYAFEMGSGITRAVREGASVINISAGYPCNLLTNFGPDFNICTEGGRAGICGVATAAAHTAAATVCAATGWVPVLGAAACAAAGSAAVAATTACLSTLAFGNLMGPMASSIHYASRAGVPVVVSAGNHLSREAYPEVIRDLVDAREARVERWHVIPAMVPESIVVGAVDDTLDNRHFWGERVDVWAPQDAAYFAPELVTDPASERVVSTFGGTSGSAPFVTGVIANMQAVNPQLNPNTEDLSDAQKAQVVPEVRAILRNTAYSNAALVGLGYSDQPRERVRLVHPLAAVEAAAQKAGWLPDLSAYDRSLNFSERLGDDDTAENARVLSQGVAQVGTILSLPAEGASVPDDEDWYRFSPDYSAERPMLTQVELRYPGSFGDLGLSGSNLRLLTRAGGAETTVTYETISGAGDVTFAVRGAPGIYNVYRVNVTESAPAVPELTILAPTEGATVCADSLVELNGRAEFPLFPSVTVPTLQLRWVEGETHVTWGAINYAAFTPGEHTVQLQAFGTTDGAKSVTFTAIPCTNEPPQVTITTPAFNLTGDNSLVWSGYDAVRQLHYVDVQLAASVTDEEDGTVAPESIVWRTNQTQYQDAVLGTGPTLTARLYGICEGVTHTISVQATDSDGNTSLIRLVLVRAYTLC